MSLSLIVCVTLPDWLCVFEYLPYCSCFRVSPTYCLYVSMCLPYSVSMWVSLIFCGSLPYFCVSVCITLIICVSLSPLLFVRRSLSPLLFVCRCVSLLLFVCRCVSLLLFVGLCVLPYWLCLADSPLLFCVCVSPHYCLCIFGCLSPLLFVCLYMYPLLFMCMCKSTLLFVCLRSSPAYCLCVFVSLPYCLFVRARACVCVRVFVCVCS